MKKVKLNVVGSEHVVAYENIHKKIDMDEVLREYSQELYRAASSGDYRPGDEQTREKI